MYSHAALWDGGVVIEASGDGGKIRTSELAVLLAEHEYTDVYRMSRDGSSDGRLSPDPVLQVARSYVGAPYPYAELCLLGVLIGLGRAVGAPRVEELMRTFGASLARIVRHDTKVLEHERPMTCSQLVALAFWEADPSPARRYALRVPYTPRGLWRDLQPVGPADGTSAELSELTRACAKVFLGADAPGAFAWRRDIARGHHGIRALGAKAMLVNAGGRDLPAACVTPRDLQSSPSLVRVGEIRE